MCEVCVRNDVICVVSSEAGNLSSLCSKWSGRCDSRIDRSWCTAGPHKTAGAAGIHGGPQRVLLGRGPKCCLQARRAASGLEKGCRGTGWKLWLEGQGVKWVDRGVLGRASDSVAESLRIALCVEETRPG